MSDIFARQRQLIGTTAEWATYDLVIGDGELAIERTTSGGVIFKVGNGVLAFSALPYYDAGLGGLPAQVATLESEVGVLEGRVTDNEEDIETAMALISSGTFAFLGGPVSAAADSNLSLTGDYTVDGVTLTNGALYLATAQTDPAENGVYVFNASGAHSRAPAMDEASEFGGVRVSVASGSTYASTVWSCTSAVATVGADPAVFVLTDDFGDMVAGKADQAYVDDALAAEADAREDLHPDFTDQSDEGAVGGVIFADGKPTHATHDAEGKPIPWAAAAILEKLNFSALEPVQITALTDALPFDQPSVVQVAAGGSMTALATAAPGVGREYPTIRKISDAPIIRQVDVAGDGVDSIYTPQLADGRLEGVNRLYLFTSTDHDSSHADTGVQFYSAPFPDAEADETWDDVTWVYHGIVYWDEDNVAGEQIETPFVIRNPSGVGWLLYFQSKQRYPGESYAYQVTRVASVDRMLTDDGAGGYTVATPADFVLGAGQDNLGGIALDAPFQRMLMGDAGHTGYASFHTWGGMVVGHSVFGGGSGTSRFACWRSYDGINFDMDRRVMSYNKENVRAVVGSDEAQFFMRPGSTVLLRGGQRWLIGTVSESTAGPSATPSGEVYTVAAPLSDDGVHIGPAIDVTAPQKSWEDPNQKGISIGSPVYFDGVHVAAYRANGKSGESNGYYSGYGLMEIV